jgi:hypothetical protein
LNSLVINSYSWNGRRCSWKTFQGGCESIAGSILTDTYTNSHNKDDVLATMHVQQCIIINLHLSNFSKLCMNWRGLVHDHFYMFRRNLIHHSQMYIMWLLNLLRLQNCTQQPGREGFYYSLLLHAETGTKN